MVGESQWTLQGLCSSNQSPGNSASKLFVNARAPLCCCFTPLIPHTQDKKNTERNQIKSDQFRPGQTGPFVSALLPLVFLFSSSHPKHIRDQEPCLHMYWCIQTRSTGSDHFTPGYQSSFFSALAAPLLSFHTLRKALLEQFYPNPVRRSYILKRFGVDKYKHIRKEYISFLVAPKAKEVQFKILNQIFPSNEFLRLTFNFDVNNCGFSGVDVKNLNHTFFHCHAVHSFCNNFRNWFQSKINLISL